MNVKINESTQPTEINWDKPQLLEYNGLDRDRMIILYTGNHAGNTISGINLFDSKYIQNELKYNFKPFNGTITLSND